MSLFGQSLQALKNISVAVNNVKFVNLCHVSKGVGTFPSHLHVKYKNPCLELQQYLDIPLFKEVDYCFEPSIQAMNCAENLFSQNKNVKCVKSAVDPKLFPIPNLPEVAFLGRSNAGKSSFLKAILPEDPKLKIIVSKKHGSTKSVKFYEIGRHLCLVDMPGYGFRQPKCFDSAVTQYLKHRKNLLKTFLLIDGKEGFHAWDDAALQMLEDFKIPFAILLTKIDVLPDSQRLKCFLHLKNIRDSLKSNTCFPQVFMISSMSGEGLAFFLAFIAHITGNLNVTVL